MRLAVLFTLALVLALPVATIAAEADDERDAWRAEIAAARARADAQHTELKAEFERRRIELQLHPLSAEDLERERARYASEQAKRDLSLQKGDIVSTDNGLFVFIGDPEGEHTPADFVPLPK